MRVCQNKPVDRRYNNEVIWLRAQMAIVSRETSLGKGQGQRQDSRFDRFPFLTDTLVHGTLHGEREREREGGERYDTAAG